MQTASMSCVRPPRPDFVEDWPWPRHGIIASARHGAKRLVTTAVDKGWFGLRPLRSHVVVCGFPRSGSTLLQLQIETCISDVRVFGKEYWAPAACQYAFRNHPYMITKAPWDVFFVDEIRAFYASRQANVRFIVTVRDPRTVLTSIHKIAGNSSDGYFIIPSQLKAYYEHTRYVQQADDVVTIEYEDLVCNPAEVQGRLAEFIGWHSHLPFDQFHTAASPDFAADNLNGLRPLDPSRLDSWRHEKHSARIRQILREVPQLPEYLIEMGYEPDTSWVTDYLDVDSMAP